MSKEDEDGVWRTVGGRRIFIRNGESLTDAMRKSGKFKKFKEKISKKPKTEKDLKDQISAWEDFKKSGGSEDDLVREVQRKKIQRKKEMERKLERMKRSSEAIAKENAKIPNRFKEGFKVQNSKYSDESKMTLVEDGSGVRLIYDGKDTGTVLRNDLSDNEISSLRNAGKIQNMSEYLDQKDTLSRPITKKDYDDRLNKISKIKEDGTYDLETGKLKNYTDGYQVTFSMTDMDFDDKAYQNLVEKFKAHDHGTVDAGKFEGYPEISFNVTDMKKALKLAYKYNQKSVWDWKNGTDISTGGTGEYKDYNPVTVDNLSKSVIRTRGLQNRILNYEDEIKTLKRKSSLTFTDKQKLMKLQREKEKLENQLK